MTHGVDGYFQERGNASRRVSLLSAGISLAVLGLLLLPAWNPAIRRALDETVRFGYEGPDQYVRRIELLQTGGAHSSLSQIGQVHPVSTRRGGSARGASTTDPHAEPRTMVRNLPGLGNAELDLAVRAVSRRSNVPVVQSEDLVIEKLVRPEYPSLLLEQNVEGKVMVQALVDTIGRVVDVQIMGSSGEAQFERAAEVAVWQCRFRPYRRAGSPSEVYAVFRFAFRIYD
jgi:TonB family protein